MWSCETCRRHLPQYIADRDVASAVARELEAHLSGCAACRDYAQRLCDVEEALRQYPLRVPSPELSERVMQVVERESRRREDDWVLLPWDVWVPALALLIALVVAVMSLPARTFGAPSPLVSLGESMVAWSQGFLRWGASLLQGANDGDFWALWTVASVLLALLGITIGWSGWRSADDDAHRQLQTRLAHMSDWLDGLLGSLGRSQ